MNDNSYRRFGAETLSGLLENLKSLLEGIKESPDIEYVHRARVSCRRLNAALSVFDGYFEKDKAKSWEKSIKQLLHALGDARDTDVQIEFLKTHITAVESEEERNFIDFLMLSKTKERENLQPKVSLAIDLIKEQGVLEQMLAECSSILANPAENEAKAATLSYAHLHISSRLEELLSFKRFVKKEKEAEAHHKMRIAAKRLRYSTEIFSKLYLEGMENEIESLKKLQDVIGEMHDCDVWLTYLSSFESDEKNELMNGLEIFESYITKQRKYLYGKYSNLWDSMVSMELFKSIRKKTGSAVVSPKPKSMLERIEKIEALASKYDPDPKHSRHVRMNALKIFDELGSFSGLGSTERYLLEAAALLHDTGWKYGSKSHNKSSSSFKIVLTEDDLPLDTWERYAVGNMVRYHTKGLPKKKHRSLKAFPENYQKKLFRTASILRLSDGLDYSHTSSVKVDSVKILPDRVLLFCELSGRKDMPPIKDKRDLFEKSFKKNLGVELMKEVNKCIVCNSDKLLIYPAITAPFIADRIWHSKPIKVNLMRCKNCGFAFYNPRLDNDEISNLYRDYRSDEYQKNRQKYEPSYTKELNESIGKNEIEIKNRKSNLSKILNENLDVSKIRSVLNFMGDNGQFIADDLVNAGKYVYGISGVTPIKGVKIIKDIPESRNMKFDFIMCCQVLEHVPYPLEILEQIKMFSHKDSVFYFEVPIDSPFEFSLITAKYKEVIERILLLFGLLKEFNRVFEMHEHTNHFSINSMKNMLVLTGFEILFIDVRTIDIGWSKPNILSCLAKLA